MSKSVAYDSPVGNEHYNVAYVWSIASVAALGGLMFGYDWIVIGGAKPFYEPFFKLNSESEIGWAMASALVGCLIGAVLSGGLSDKFGRKRLLILAALVFAVSSVGTGLAATFMAFNLWRIAGGVAIGLASNLSPMYIAEIAPARARGKLVAMNQFTIVIGILLAQSANYFIAQRGMRVDEHRVAASSQAPSVLEAPKVAEDLAWQLPLDQRPQFIEQFTKLAADRGGKVDGPAVAAIVAELQRSDSRIKFDPTLVELAVRQLPSWNRILGWSWMFGVTALPAVFFFVLMFFVPESPRWLAKNGKSGQARAILARIGGQAHADQELTAIEETLKGEIESVNFGDLLEPRVFKILLLGVTLAVLQQWCGLNVIFYYAADIFKAAGYNVSDAMLNIVVIGAVNFVFTIIALYSVDRFGRKILMLIGFGGIALIHLLLGASYFAHLTGTPVLILTLAAIACYGFTLAPVTWVVLSEIFPNRIRGAAMSISVFALWAACFILTDTFPHMLKWLGPAGTFWSYAAICMAGFVFVIIYLPETKGKTLEQIERELVD